MGNIKGKVVVITGASSGMGEAAARYLSALGARVVLGARRADRIDELARKINDQGGKALALATDVTQRDQVKKLVNDEAIYQIGGEKTGACQGTYVNHRVTIKDGMVSPLHTEANRCDTLTFIDEDSVSREIAFGAHIAHEPYAGNLEIPIRRGMPKTITLSESGTYRFHDHLQEQTAGDFTVKP